MWQKLPGVPKLVTRDMGTGATESASHTGDLPCHGKGSASPTQEMGGHSRPTLLIFCIVLHPETWISQAEPEEKAAPISCKNLLA